MIATLANLDGKRGLVTGIANEHSIAYGCAQAFHAAGAQTAITYLNAKAEPFVRPLAEGLGSPLILPCDLYIPGQLEAVFERITQRWGELDFLLHSIAFAPKDDLHGRLIDCSEEGFLLAMRLSCHSFIGMARLAEPLMRKGGSLLTISYYGANKAVAHYGLMGPVKAALESTVRYMAAELGAKDIRVNALSPGPIRTRAASGVRGFDELLEGSVRRSPMHRRITIEEVGAAAAFLASDMARSITGATHYIDGGYHIVG